MTEGQYQALREPMRDAINAARRWPSATPDELIDAVLPIAQRELAARDAVIEQIRAQVRRLADALTAQVSDENAECVACGGSAVGDPDEHFDNCWVAREIAAVLSSLPSTGGTKAEVCAECHQPFSAPPCCLDPEGVGRHVIEGGCAAAPASTGDNQPKDGNDE